MTQQFITSLSELPQEFLKSEMEFFILSIKIWGGLSTFFCLLYMIWVLICRCEKMEKFRAAEDIKMAIGVIGGVIIFFTCLIVPMLIWKIHKIKKYPNVYVAEEVLRRARQLK